jgi:hypothetical protein
MIAVVAILGLNLYLFSVHDNAMDHVVGGGSRTVKRLLRVNEAGSPSVAKFDLENIKATLPEESVLPSIGPDDLPSKPEVESVLTIDAMEAAAPPLVQDDARTLHTIQSASSDTTTSVEARESIDA